MKTFSKILLTVPAVLIALVGFAQPPANQQQKDPSYDPKAKAILDEVSKTAKAYTSITANFTVTTKSAKGDLLTKNGTVVMKGSKYKITIDNKVKGVVKKEEYYNDGKTIWTYSEKDNEVTIDCAPEPGKKKDNAISPTDLFTIHEKGFKYSFIKEETQSGKLMQLIDLVPEKPEQKNYHRIRLTIDKTKKQIVKIELFHKDQSTTTYAITLMTPNLDVTDATFQFDKKAHTGVSEIDIRDEGCGGTN
jgi:outer membrane lipoprotein-sorting protein